MNEKCYDFLFTLYFIIYLKEQEKLSLQEVKEVVGDKVFLQNYYDIANIYVSHHHLK